MKKWHEVRNAPAPGTFLCQAADLGDKQVKEFTFAAESVFPFRMFIYNDLGEFKAYKNACPHFDVPLNHTPGEVFTSDRRYFLCMTHFAKFEPGSGLCVEGPCVGESMERIPLRKENGRLLINVLND